MKRICKRLLSFLLVLTMILSMGALQVWAAEETSADVASYGGRNYNSLDEALQAAEETFRQTNAQQVVTLVGNVQTEDIVIPYGVTLDCNSKEITVTYLLSYGSIINTGNGGRLYISGGCQITDSDSAVPVYLPEEDCYILRTHTQESLGVREKNDAVVFGYTPNFTDLAVYNAILAGGSKLNVLFSLEWDGCEEALIFACSEELMQQYAQLALHYADMPVKVALQLHVTNMEVLGSGKDVSLTPILMSEIGAAIYGEPMYYRTAGVKVDLADTENGTVVTDSNYYELGSTITLTVTPDAGYGLKRLEVMHDGQPINIGSTSFSGGQYSFVAEQEEYTVHTEFAKSMFTPTKGSWDLSNQFNGSITILSQKDGTTVTTNAGNYKEVAVTVSDLAPTYDENGKGNFSMQISFLFDNGKKYEVRLHNTDANSASGKYKLQNMGSSASVTGTSWKWQADLTAAQVAKLLSGGVEFTVKLVDRKAQLWVDGSLMAIVDLGEESRDVAQIGLCMNGNTGVQNLEIPFALRTAAEATSVQVNIAEVVDGTVTAQREVYQKGDTVTLTVTPNEGYALKDLVIRKDGKRLDIGSIKSTGGSYSFVAEAGVYTVEAKFTQPIFTVVGGSWDLSDQFNGSITITEQKSATSVSTTANDYEGICVTIKDHTPSKNADGSLKKGNFSAQVYLIFANGKQFQVRIHNTDADGNYKIQTMGETNSFTRWKWRADLTTAQKANLLDGDGVAFAVKIVGTNAEMYIDGTKMVTVALEENGVSYDGSLAQVKLVFNGNTGMKNMRLPFQLLKPQVPMATITVPSFENGTVTTDVESCEIGDTVTLTVTPNDGYSQQLYINGQPLLLNWKTNTYSFKVTEETYEITGSFVPVMEMTATDESRWDTANQAQGVLNTYYPGYSNASLIQIPGDYQAVTVKAKNYLAGANGTGGEGFAVNIGFKFNNGKEYAFRVIRENGKYNCQRFQINGSDWSKQALDSAAIAAICGEGAAFKVERTAANTLTVSVNGTVYDTYTMEGITEDNWVTAVTFNHYGNKGEKVAIPYALTESTISGTIAFKSAELSKYVIIYDYRNSDYAQLAKQLKNHIYQKYGVSLSVYPDLLASKRSYEILLGDTNRYDEQGAVMEYSVTVGEGVFKINVGGSFSAEKAISYLGEKVFDGQEIALRIGEHFHTSFLTNSRAIIAGTTARVMTANVLADAFADTDTYRNANYRAEVFAGMLVSYTPDVVGMQEVDSDWSSALNKYLTRIEKVYGIKYSRCLATYGGKVNYSSFIYRSDKFKVENSGLEAFSWWKDLGANYRYHMRNVSWVQFASLENSDTKFVVANTHWSYRTEHADGNTYLTGAQKPIATDELRQQCRVETSQYLSTLKETYPTMPIFLTGDFNTSLSYFTQYNWTPTSFEVISEQAKSAGKALSTVPTSGHYDHLFGTGSYSILCYEFLKNINQHSVLTDHPFAYADLAF